MHRTSTSVLVLLVPLLAAGCAGSRPSAATEPSPLEGTAWRLEAFGEAAAQPAAGSAELTAVFSDSGRVAGLAGCNHYFGTYQVEGTLLTISGIGATLMACAPEVMARERAFLDALGAVRGWRRQGSNLVLTDAAGASLLRFAAAGARAPSVVTGSVTYRPRIALPPDAVVRVRLEDVSLADAPATVLAEQTIRTQGRQVPIAFTLDYDPARIEPRHRYAVRAEIRDGSGHLLWVSDTVHPVLTQGAPSEDVEIQMVQVNQPGGGEGGREDAQQHGMEP